MATTPTLVHVIGNRIATTLSSGINSSALSISVASGSGLNASGGYIIIDKGLSTQEVIYVESVSGTTLTVSSDGRGRGGTSAAAHSSGAIVNDVLVNEHVEGLITDFLVAHNADGSHQTLPSLVTTGDVTVGDKIRIQNNNKAILQKDVSGTYREIVKLDSGDDLVLGTPVEATDQIKLNGVLTALSTSIPFAEYRKSGNQTIATAASTALTWDTEITEQNMSHNTVTNTSRITALYTGLYIIYCRVRWTTDVGAYEVTIDLLKNGTTVQSSIGTTGDGAKAVNGVCFIQLAANDYIELAAYQASGGNKDVEGGSPTYSTRIIIAKLL